MEDLKTIQLNDQKAGMQGLNKEAINKIIYEASKGTAYFNFQQKRQRSIDLKVTNMLGNLKKITEHQKQESLQKMNAFGIALENERDLSHSIVHIDMDAFYAAVEMRDDPSLKEIPMAVGSLSMLSTSNYHARKYGVRAAMPGFIAKKLCPELKIVHGNFYKYRTESNKIKEIIKEYDPDYCSSGLDEVYLDLTQYINKIHEKKMCFEHCQQNSDFSGNSETDKNISLHEESHLNHFNECEKCSKYKPLSYEERDKLAFDIVQEIREKIYKATNLTASAGIAPNTMLAKVCSDQNKPNGQYQIPSDADAVKSFISNLPVKKISGIGPVQSQILNGIGIYILADMWEKRDIVDLLFKYSLSRFYIRVSLGIGSTTVKSDYVRKSIGGEETFKEISRPEDLHAKCQELCDDMIDHLKSRNLVGKVLILKIKTTSFETRTRNHSFSFYTSDDEIISKAAKKLIDAEIAACAPQPLKLRLMGIRMANLVDEHSVPQGEKQHIKLKDFLQGKVASPTKLKQEDIQDNDNINVSEICKINNENNLSDKTSQVKNLDIMDTCENLNEPCKNLEFTNYTCPVCGIEQQVLELGAFNSHIDTCLNKLAIKEMLASDRPQILSVDKPQNEKRKQSPKKISLKKRKQEIKSSKKIEDFFYPKSNHC